MLSHHIHGRSFNLTPSSLSRASFQISLAVAFAKALYSALVLEQETVACLRALQYIKFGPKNMAKPPVEHLSSKEPAQTASKKSLRSVEEFF